MSGKYRFIQKTLASFGGSINNAAAEKVWLEELIRLQKLNKPCLLKVTSDDLIVFPTGLLKKIKKFFHMNSVETDKSIVDMRKKPKRTNGFPVVGKKLQLRYYQKEAVVECLKEEQGTIVAGTGTGKTAMMQELIQKLGLKTVVVVPSLSILGQTEKRFREYFGRGKVGSFSGLAKKPKAITIACAPSLAKSDPKMWEDVDVICFDECHHTPCDTVDTIVYKVFPKAHYRFGFTATNHRTDGANLSIEAAVFPPIYSYSVEKGIEEKFLATPRFLMFNVDFSSYKRYNGKMPIFAYKYHMIRNAALNKKIIDHANSFLKQGKQVLILVREKDHGHILHAGIPGATFVRNKATEKKGKKYLAPYVKPDDAVASFNAGKIRCLIGTSIIGEGTDIVPVDVLFNLMGGISKVTVMQNIGRALRPAPGKNGVWIIDYIHATNQMLEKHSFKRHDIYKRVGKVDILELTK